MKHGIIILDWFSYVDEETKDKIINSLFYSEQTRSKIKGGEYLETDDDNVLACIKIICEEGTTDKEIVRLKAKIKSFEDTIEDKIEILENVIEDLRNRNRTI